MGRIRVNNNNFKYPRRTNETFSFTEDEELFLNKELEKLESNFPEEELSIFSISKQDGFFSGSLRLKSSNIYTYGKAPTAIGLFYKLREKIKVKIYDNP